MKVLAALFSFIFLVIVGAFWLRLSEWDKDLSELARLQRKVLDELNYGPGDQEDRFDRLYPEIIYYDRRIADLLRNKPWGVPLLPIERKNLKNIERHIAEFDRGEAASLSDFDGKSETEETPPTPAPNRTVAATPRPLPPRTPSPEEMLARQVQENARRAAEIARKYASPK